MCIFGGALVHLLCIFGAALVPALQESNALHVVS